MAHRYYGSLLLCGLAFNISCKTSTIDNRRPINERRAILSEIEEENRPAIVDELDIPIEEELLKDPELVAAKQRAEADIDNKLESSSKEISAISADDKIKAKRDALAGIVESIRVQVRNAKILTTQGIKDAIAKWKERYVVNADINGFQVAYATAIYKVQNQLADDWLKSELSKETGLSTLVVALKNDKGFNELLAKIVSSLESVVESNGNSAATVDIEEIKSKIEASVEPIADYPPYQEFVKRISRVKAREISTWLMTWFRRSLSGYKISDYFTFKDLSGPITSKPEAHAVALNYFKNSIDAIILELRVFDTPQN